MSLAAFLSAPWFIQKKFDFGTVGLVRPDGLVVRLKKKKIVVRRRALGVEQFDFDLRAADHDTREPVCIV